MTTRTKPKIGERALFYGKTLVVVGIEKKTLSDDSETEVVAFEDAEARERRTPLEEEYRALRAQLSADADELSRSERDVIETRMRELDAAMREDAVAGVKLRRELLSFWSERDLWVSEGRILSDEEREAFRKITGAPVHPGQHRAAKDLLEGGR